MNTQKQPSPEINVTPLVDVVLVLLIIFMVIAPALNEGEQIELPQVLVPDAKPKDLNPIDVTITIDGRVLLDKKVVDPNDLEKQVRALHAEDEGRKLMLKADGALPYEDVRKTFALLQSIGFRGVSLKVIERKGGA